MTLRCVHGFPHPANCVDCMAEGPIAPPRPSAEQKLWAQKVIPAKFNGQCGRDSSHPIVKGDPIGLTAEHGWCCESCFVVPQETR